MKYKTRSGRLYNGGNEGLRYSIEYPAIERDGGAARFFETMAKNCEEYCRGVLFEQVKEMGKHYVYRLRAHVTHCDDRVLSVLLWIRLLEERERVFEFKRAVNRDLETDLLIPPSLLIKRYGKGRGKRRKIGEPILLDGQIVDACSISGERLFER